MADTRRPLWTCPKCGNRFVTANTWHSCGAFALDDHFAGKDRVVREVFDRLLTLIERCGPAVVIPQKSRIAIQARVRFAGGVARKHWFDGALWLRRRAQHPCLRKVERFGKNSYGLHFRLASPADLDRKFAALVREAYSVGCQEHVAQ
jgi:hypothetical protein